MSKSYAGSITSMIGQFVQDFYDENGLLPTARQVIESLSDFGVRKNHQSIAYDKIRDLRERLAKDGKATQPRTNKKRKHKPRLKNDPKQTAGSIMLIHRLENVQLQLQILDDQSREGRMDATGYTKLATLEAQLIKQIEETKKRENSDTLARENPSFETIVTRGVKRQATRSST